MNIDTNLNTFAEAVSYQNHLKSNIGKSANILVVSAYIDGISNYLNHCGNDDILVNENIQILKNRIDLSQFDFVIATDGGLKLCDILNVKANLVIGDFDSQNFIQFRENKNISFEKLPVEKDITDLEAALTKAITLNPSSICVLGGLGGRLDHSLANIEHLANYAKHVPYIYFLDCFNYITVQYPCVRSYSSALGKHFAVLSHFEKSDGIYLENAYYKLENATLFKNIPLGVSNSFVGDEIKVSLESGCLVIIISNYK